MTWILILTLTWDGYKAGAPAITTATGFQSEHACMVAADMWLKQALAMDAVSSARAMCAPTR